MYLSFETLILVTTQTAHSAFPESPLGPDAYQEYEALLVQDYEELVKKSGSKSRGKLEDEEHPLSTSSRKDAVHLEAGSNASLGEDNPLDYIEDAGPRLGVSVNHFPLILCPLSPRVFVLPSEGLVAEAYLSTENEDSISPGLPPMSTGVLSDADDVPPGATLTAHLLYHLASKVTTDAHPFDDMSNDFGDLFQKLYICEGFCCLFGHSSGFFRR